MQFYRKAESAASQILEAFQTGNLSQALAPIFIRRKDNVPCRAWSWSNQLLAALNGTSDARGYRQWQEVGRQVKKGEKSFPILVPIVRKRTTENRETGQEEEIRNKLPCRVHQRPGVRHRADRRGPVAGPGPGGCHLARQPAAVGGCPGVGIVD